MALKKDEKTISGSKWMLNTLPATTGLGAATQLAAIVGAPIGAVAGGVKANTDLMDLDAGMIGEAVAKMSSRLAEPGTIALAQTLLTDLRKHNGKGWDAVDFDIEFAANYGTLTQLLAWSVKLNFASFFDGNPVFGALLKKGEALIRGHSTGESGES